MWLDSGWISYFNGQSVKNLRRLCLYFPDRILDSELTALILTINTVERKNIFYAFTKSSTHPSKVTCSTLSEATLFKFKLNKVRWNKKLLWYVMPLLISPVGQTNSFPFVEHPAWDKPYITTVLLIQGCHSQSACCLLYQSGSNTKDLSLHCHRHH